MVKKKKQKHIERYQNNEYKNSPYYVGNELWNKLPLDVLQSQSLYQFKTELKKSYTRYEDDT